MDFHIAGIGISTLWFNVIMTKYEASGKITIQSIKKNIQALYLKIKVMDIDHFHDNVNYLTTTLEAHGMIILDLMHHLFMATNLFLGQ